MIGFSLYYIEKYLIISSIYPFLETIQIGSIIGYDQLLVATCTKDSNKNKKLFSFSQAYVHKKIKKIWKLT